MEVIFKLKRRQVSTPLRENKQFSVTFADTIKARLSCILKDALAICTS